jgi:YHS domain-containing protein
MKIIWLITTLIIGLVTFSALAQMEAHQQDQPAHSMPGMEAQKPNPNMDKARCAYDGMLMKASAMVSMKHGDETLYFCNEEQMKAFHKSPKQYLKKATIGDLHVLMNVLTMKEYMDMMRSMGMGSMVKMGDKDATHWINVYLASEQSPTLSGIAVKVVAPNGEASFKELEYNKMMKGYTGQLALPEGRKYKLHSLLGLPGIEMP